MAVFAKWVPITGLFYKYYGVEEGIENSVKDWKIK